MSTAADNFKALRSPSALDWRSNDVAETLVRALAEDLGADLPAKGTDLTTAAVLPEQVEAVGTLLANESLVVAGLPLVARLFELLDPQIRFQMLAKEGSLVARGPLGELRGDARSLLRGERTALNFLQRLSGIATLTQRFVQCLEGTKTKIRDTRKTTPGLRLLERYAVRIAGGSNHRFGLFDAVLIKENHAQLAGGVGLAIQRAREQYGGKQPVQAEVRDENELRQALEAGADAILLDNMAVEDVRRAVALIAGRALVEASGGIGLENVRAYAECGVDYISVGALTHSAPAADISLDVVPDR